MVLRPLAAAAVLAFSLGMAGSVQAAANPKRVIEAERAFAADGRAMGVKRSFLKHMADDAVIFAPDPVNAKQYYSGQPDDGGPKLVWWPTVAAISRGNDLGFTMGPYELEGRRGGHFFTIWKRQADGSLKWVLDGSVENDAARAATDGDVDTFPNGVPTVSGDRNRPERSASYAPEGAMSDQEGAEIALNRDARGESHEAYDDYLSSDAIVMGSANAPAVGEDAVDVEIKSRPRRIVFTRSGGGMARTGDFAWSYGAADWTVGGEKHRGHYVRVWQKRTGGWKIIFDVLKEAR